MRNAAARPRAALAAVLAFAVLAAPAHAAPVPPARPDPNAPPAEPGAAEPAAPQPEGPAALLRGLDKFSGVAEAFYAPVGGVAVYGRLTILVRACERRDAEGDVAWLTIADARAPGAPVFEGWMFAESPALSALDHPRYDVWLAQCRTEDAGAF
jgi:hypothetical protein